MHQHITADNFRELVNGVKQSAIAVTEKYKDTKEPITVVGFIDECTSTSVMGMMKEVLVDKSLDGELLPPNIMWIGAFNRNSVNAKEKVVIEDFTHMNDSDLSNLDFAVRPPPPSLEILEVAFDPLNSEQQRHFIRNLIALRARLNAAKIGRDPKHHTELLEALTFSHQYLGKANQRRIHPSIRDIVRCVDLYTYFRTHPAYYAATKDCDTVSEQDRHRHALVLAIGFCYYFRLRQDLRAGYAAAFVKGGHVFPAYKIPGSNVNTDPFYWTFREVGMNLYRNTEFLEGVAPTNSFLQNLLLTVACIDAKIPLMIVGPPGCSKTLSFTIAIKNMQGNQSSQALLPQAVARRASALPVLQGLCGHGDRGSLQER